VTKATHPCFAVLLVSDFSLQALLRTRPELATQPVALLDGDRRRALIHALTPPAQAAGVTPGLTAPQALSRCPALLVQQVNTGADDEASAALLAAATTLSPLVEDTAPGVTTIDVTALPPAQRQPRLEAALSRLATLGLTATAGIAPTPLLALYAARVASSGTSKFQVTSSKYQEAEEQPLFAAEQPPQPTGIAKEKEKDKEERERGPSPNSSTVSGTSSILVVTDARAFLAPLPLAAADPKPEHTEILRMWGITTLGQLTALAKADVAQRLGLGGLALWERAAGEATRPIQPLPPPRSFAAEMELEHAIESLEPLLFLLRRFVDRLCLDLQGVALAAAELDLSLRLDDETTYQRSIRLPEPTASPDHLFGPLQSHLATVTTDTAIVAIRLELFPTRPLHRQQGLFDAGLRDPHGFAETLARAAALLGSDQIGTPQLTDSHRPDAVSLAPPATSEALEPPTPAPLPALGVPLRRFRPPVPAQVELRPHSRVPVFVRTDHLQGAIKAHHGPWRANGEWWQSDQAWTREEWDVALGPPTHGLYRLSHTPSGWYLDGEYD
jgi:protein ImuB